MGRSCAAPAVLAGSKLPWDGSPKHLYRVSTNRLLKGLQRLQGSGTKRSTSSFNLHSSGFYPSAHWWWTRRNLTALLLGAHYG